MPTIRPAWLAYMLVGLICTSAAQSQDRSPIQSSQAGSSQAVHPQEKLPAPPGIKAQVTPVRTVARPVVVHGPYREGTRPVPGTATPKTDENVKWPRGFIPPTTVSSKTIPESRAAATVAQAERVTGSASVSSHPKGAIKAYNTTFGESLLGGLSAANLRQHFGRARGRRARPSNRCQSHGVAVLSWSS